MEIKLTPCRLEVKAEKINGKEEYKKTLQILSASRHVIAADLPLNISRYIVEAINKYMLIKYPSSLGKDVICSFAFPGKPIAISERKVISQNSDGTFSIGLGAEFSKRIKRLKGLRKEIIYGRTGYTPFKTPVILECIFYIKKAPNKNVRLSELVSSTLFLLCELKILKTDDVSVVVSTDGSKVWYIEDEMDEKTIIRIRKVGIS